MNFWLGTHRPNWLGQVSVPLMVSHSTLARRKTYPRALGPWALDSGGFSELSLRGGWAIPAEEYVARTARIVEGVGMPDWIAPQDWMCEPWIIERTGLSVEEHQERTVGNYLEIRRLAPTLPVAPVLQGWRVEDYERCARLYEDAGVKLTSLPLVGLGSVCRRQDTGPAEDIVLGLQPLRLHGFGVKANGLRRYGYLLESADSMAWSYAGRRRGSCAGRSRCTNHLHYALAWRRQLLSSMDYQQPHLAMASR